MMCQSLSAKVWISNHLVGGPIVGGPIVRDWD